MVVVRSQEAPGEQSLEGRLIFIVIDVDEMVALIVVNLLEGEGYNIIIESGEKEEIVGPQYVQIYVNGHVGVKINF